LDSFLGGNFVAVAATGTGIANAFIEAPQIKTFDCLVGYFLQRLFV
jgi:hypothetical protein